MRVLLDTNVVLDVLLNHQPWVKEATAIWQANDEGQITGYIVASTLTDIFYIARRLTNLETANKAILLCLEAFEICAVDRNVLERAVTLPGVDFEDNLQIACAQTTPVDAIITRNSNDFKTAPILVLTPAELVAQLGEHLSRKD
jgi:predicted nucleic acid-binding protein